MEFVHQTAEGVNCFKPTNDIDTVLAGDILIQLESPTPISSSRCPIVKLTDSEYQRVQEAFRSKVDNILWLVKVFDTLGFKFEQTLDLYLINWHFHQNFLMLYQFVLGF